MTLLRAQSHIISHWHTVADPADAIMAALGLLSVSAMGAATPWQAALRLPPVCFQCPQCVLLSC